MTAEEAIQAWTEHRTLRAAIFDVIDAHRYRLYEGTVFNTSTGAPTNGVTEEYANAQRLDFADAVIARMKGLGI